MINVCGIKFNKKGRVYYFNSNGINVLENQSVVVETERGLQFGTVVVASKEIDENNLVSPLKNVIRIATKYDIKQNNKNEKDNKTALERASNIVKELNLNMKLLDASYTLDRNQLLFNFVSDERIDFRELLKRLAAVYKTRIELRQIGIRDKAKEVGGLGPCGRFLCCNSFLTDLNSVTINMAKNQALALNPTKINGVCGRLLCCLSYEDETYTELKQGLPNVGDDYEYNNQSYKVVDVDILKRKVTLSNDKTKEVINL
ncbi:MAG: stage 0 sporulation family protein [Bacilli bacterium]|nr:stage 0 sporulation family protein [Bacilli bacterium]